MFSSFTVRLLSHPEGTSGQTIGGASTAGGESATLKLREDQSKEMCSIVSWKLSSKAISDFYLMRLYIMQTLAAKRSWRQSKF